MQFVMEEMFFSGTPLLEAVGLREPFVKDLRQTVTEAMTRALIPMKAYAEQYETFLPIINLDIGQYIRSLFTHSGISLLLNNPLYFTVK